MYSAASADTVTHSLVLCVCAGFGAAAFMAPLLQNLCLSMGNNEEACFCLKVRQQQQRNDCA